MKEILPNIFAVEVPDDSRKFVIKNGAYTKWLWVDGERHVVLNLKAGIKKLFTTKDCTEEQVDTILPDTVFPNSIDGLKFHLRTNKLDPDKNYLLLKKIS